MEGSLFDTFCVNEPHPLIPLQGEGRYSLRDQTSEVILCSQCCLPQTGESRYLSGSVGH